jgi:mono/diheme cytochrome c family protein
MKTANPFRMNKRIQIWLATAVILFGGVALGRKRPPTAEEIEAELHRAPAEAAQSQNPYAGQPEAAVAGRKLYLRRCAQCHAPGGEGKEKAPSLRAPVIQNAAPGILFWMVKNGNRKNGMPGWAGLPEQQIWQVVTYVKSLGPETRPAEERTPAAEKRE